jgi:hypothetical protein
LCIRHGATSNLFVVDIQAAPQVLILIQGAADAFISQGQYEGRVALLSANVEVRGTAPGMFATQ